MAAGVKADTRRKATHPARPTAAADVKLLHAEIAKRYPKILAKLAE